MTIKSVVMALGVIGTVVLGNGMTANAQSNQTDKEEASSASKTEAPEQKVIVVKAGDTLDAIASANDTTYIRLFNANEAIVHPDRIDVGDEITIPTPDAELPDRFAQLMQAPAPVAATPVSAPVAAAASTAAQCDEATQWVRADNGQCLDKPGTYRQAVAQPVAQVASAPAVAPVSYGSSSYQTGNGMWCTDYVHSRRPDVPIYGNAGMFWIGAAQAQGKATGTTPRPGAVAVMPGHVAIVERVNPDGTYVVSEMGWMYQAGNYNVRTVSPGAFGGFIY